MATSEKAQAHHNGVLRLGETRPEKVPVEVNGRRLEAWVTTNRRYPASVAGMLDDARQRYLATRRARVEPLPTENLIAAITHLLDNLEQPGIHADARKQAAQEAREALDAWGRDPQFETNPVAWQQYMTECLMLLIPGLEEEEAELLGEQRFEVLVALGYFLAPEQAPPAAGPTDREPDKSSTGATPEPVSAGSTS